MTGGYPWRLAGLWCLLAAWNCSGHELRPAYLELVEHNPGIYRVTWKQARPSATRPLLIPVFPVACSASVKVLREAAAARVETWQLDCSPGGLAGQTLTIDGLNHGLVDVFVHIETLQGVPVYRLLRAGRAELVVDDTRPLFAYLMLGVSHLLLGYDHVLFILGLLFLVRGFVPLLKTITAFTLAHSITLALAAFGLVRFSSPAVEAAIALSLLYLAVEALRPTGGDRRSAGGPWLMALVFGLLHGFGFASVLADTGLPKDLLVRALLLFNLGIELGQLALVAAALCARWCLLRVWAAPPALLIRSPLYAMGTFAGFLLWQRLSFSLGG